ncbi:hypothetical protein CAP36_14750 [Chitinophagaceae bacterium IBVUCB2]|nr:hypothetical protein CAP36_14750 [Chitinophagaceae bacterium IBVUCB2]
MRKFLFHCVLLSFTILIGSSCKKEKGVPTLPTVPPILLKEINTPSLPSPYYRFEYNMAGKPIFASFASGLFSYNIIYTGERISEMQNNIIVNKDKLQYIYGSASRVDTILYADSTGFVYKRVCFSYEGQKLIKAERQRKTADCFIIEKTMTLFYYPDGNLRELKDHRHPVNGQVEYTAVDMFEQYDDKTNVDGFSLLHNDFFEHLFLLPGVKLQENNPGKLTRTGDGLNYSIGYSYFYNDNKLPLTKTGLATISSGPDAGKTFQTRSDFSYY